MRADQVLQQAHRALCRNSIALALAALERAGVLKITRRLVRVVDELGIVGVRQGSNLYALNPPPERLHLGSTQKPPQIRPSERVCQTDRNHHKGVLIAISIVGVLFWMYYP